MDDLRYKIHAILNYHQGDGSITIPVTKLLNDLREFGVDDIGKYIISGTNRQFLETLGCRFADAINIYTGNADKDNAGQRMVEMMRNTPGSKPPSAYRRPTSGKQFFNWSKVHTSAPMVCRGDPTAVLRSFVPPPCAPGVPTGPRMPFGGTPVSPRDTRDDHLKPSRISGVVGNHTYDAVTKFVARTGCYEQPRMFPPNSYGAQLHSREPPFRPPCPNFLDDSDEEDEQPMSSFSARTPNPPLHMPNEHPIDDASLIYPLRPGPTMPPAEEKKPAPPVPVRRFTSPLPTPNNPSSNILPPGRDLKSPPASGTPSSSLYFGERGISTSAPSKPAPFGMFPEGRDLKSPGTTGEARPFDLFPNGRDLKSPPATASRTADLFPSGRDVSASSNPAPFSLYPDGRDVKGEPSKRPDMFPSGRDLKSPPAAESPAFDLFPSGRDVSSAASKPQPFNMFPDGRDLKSPAGESRSFNMFPDGRDLKKPTPADAATDARSLPDVTTQFAALGIVPRSTGYTSDDGNSGNSRVQSPTNSGIRRRFTQPLPPKPSTVPDPVIAYPINPDPDRPQVTSSTVTVSTADNSELSTTVPKKKITYAAERTVNHTPMTMHQISFKAANLLSALQFDPKVSEMTKTFAENLLGDLDPGFACWQVRNIVTDTSNKKTFVPCKRILCSNSDRLIVELAKITMTQFNHLVTPKRFLLGCQYFAFVEELGVIRVVYSTNVNENVGMFFYADHAVTKVVPFPYLSLREIPRENVFRIPNIVEWFEPDAIHFKNMDVVTIFPTGPPKLNCQRAIYPCKIYKTNLPTPSFD